jgi:ABC-2 type transport system ATP-binding protein
MKPIEAVGLWKYWDFKPVLMGLDFSVREHSVTGLLGRNGAGKSTLIKSLLGACGTERGKASVLGQDLWLLGGIETKRRVGYVSEEEIFPSYARIEDLIRLERVMRDDWQEAGLRQWLDSAVLSSKRRVSALSKGTRKRLELEILLAGRPDVILMDEPFSGLDPVSRAEFMESFMDYLAEHPTTVLVSSHILSDLERFCDQIAVLAAGRIALELPLDALKEGGGILTKSGDRVPVKLPFKTKVLSSRQALTERTWVVTGLKRGQAPKGCALRKPALEEFGVELLRCLDAKEAAHV